MNTSYRVCFAYSLKSLTDMVNQSLDLGWKCQGGLCLQSVDLNLQPATIKFMQAMIKK